MRKKTLRMISSILTLVFLVSLFQAEFQPVQAAKTATIDVNIGGKTYHVTPGQKVIVNTPAGQTVYDMRFVDGKPVAFTMEQYTELIMGEGASSSSGTSSSNSNTSTSAKQNNNSGKQTASSGKQTSNSNSSQSSASTSQTSNSSSQTSAATPSSSANSGQMSWNEFQKANAGKGMSSSEMSQAYKQYKQTGNSGSAAASTGSNSSSSSTSAQPAEISTSVAEGAAPTAQTSGNAAQGSTQAAQTSGNAAQGSTQTAQASTVDSSASTSAPKSGWDPAKHPRDPQTGKFISHEEAVARGLMDPADANISSNSSSSQTAQAGSDSSAAGQSSSTDVATSDTGAGTVSEGTSGTNVAQAGSDSAASGAKESKPSVGDKFKSGYQTGKNLTKQGFQNVKDSVKSGFSAKNLLVTAGITVGVDLATQIMRGENPSLKSALKQVCCAEFVGSVTGSVLGSAAGSFFVPFLSCVPVVGGVLSALAPAFGSVVGSAVGAYTAGDLKNGRFSIKEGFKRLDWVGVTGQAIGSTAGAALGSVLGPIGTVVGGMVGGYFGNWAAHKIAGMFGKGSADLPVIATPVGTTGKGIADASTITIGADNVTGVTIVDELPVAAADKDDDKPSSEGMDGSQIEEAVNQAYEEYTEYYSEYSKLIQAGKQAEALEVAQKMNAAKARYDELRKKG